MHVLFISRWFPYPPIHGSKQRVYHLIRALAERHQVSLLSFADHPSIQPEAPEMRALCADVQVVPWRDYRPHRPRTLLSLLSATPRSIVDTHSAEMAERVRRACGSGAYAAVVASQLTSASYHASFAGLPAVFDEIELGVFHDRRRDAASWIARRRHALTWAKLRRYLAHLLRDIDAATVVSAAEEALLRSAVASAPPITIVPNGTIVPNEVTPASQRAHDTLVFAGALTYAANAEGLRWFLATAYPQVRARRPHVSLTVTGETGGVDLANDGVWQTGHIPDAGAVVAGAAVSIAPLRWGGGTRLKILEAMALGTPVVATAKAAEGLGATDGEHLLIADQPGHFSQAILRLLADSHLRQRLADNARRLVVQRYQWCDIGRRFVDLVEEVLRSRRAADS